MSQYSSSEISEKNVAFWDTLCGTGLAEQLQITDDSLESLKKYDDFYFDFYHYLLKRIDLELMRNKDVFEVGLGYGSLGQELAKVAKNYIGMDIAAGPVEMMNHRLSLNQLSGRAQQGNMLHCFMQDNSVDAVVSIGCFHHTGDLVRCFQEAYRILRPGGILKAMVYNQYSFRRFKNQPFQILKEMLIKKQNPLSASEAERKMYDTLKDEGAPETVFISCKNLKHILNPFEKVKLKKENADPLFSFSRSLLLKTIGPLWGLDIYISAQKPFKDK